MAHVTAVWKMDREREKIKERGREEKNEGRERGTGCIECDHA